ncbi:MAG: TonB C-terminal domain-containing protein [Deltaproteobacteria bacterium]|nr:TonB C-terminal domain-containing protein [Deltaproteobacteria bacterium]
MSSHDVILPPLHRSAATRSRAGVVTIASVALHLGVGALAWMAPAPADARVPRQELVEVSIVPALGHASGALGGTGTQLSADNAAGRARNNSVRSAPEVSAGKPPASSLPGDSPAMGSRPESTPYAVGGEPDNEAKALSHASASAGNEASATGDDSSSPALGSANGATDGTGSAPQARMTPQYAGLLAGWFGARFNVRGTGIDEAELSKLAASVRISISSDRRVVGFQLAGSSGNASFDEAVRGTLAGVMSSGVPLPSPQDGSLPPSSFTVRFRSLNLR